MSSLPVLDHILRPIEIYNCLWQSASNEQSNQPRKCPHECACDNLPAAQQNACNDGFFAIGRSENTGVFGQLNHTRTHDPNSIVGWCLNENNISSPYNNDQMSKDAWTIGCLNGIRGYHKAFRDGDRSVPCDQLEIPVLPPAPPATPSSPPSPSPSLNNNNSQSASTHNKIHFIGQHRYPHIPHSPSSPSPSPSSNDQSQHFQSFWTQ